MFDMGNHICVDCGIRIEFSPLEWVHSRLADQAFLQCTQVGSKSQTSWQGRQLPLSGEGLPAAPHSAPPQGRTRQTVPPRTLRIADALYPEDRTRLHRTKYNQERRSFIDANPKFKQLKYAKYNMVTDEREEREGNEASDENWAHLNAKYHISDFK